MALISILLVDDNALFRRSLRAMLDVEECLQVVGEAEDGETAVSLVRDLEPDIVVMDVSMPGIGGIEATRRIVACVPQVAVIGLSIHASEIHANAMRSVGARCLLAKGADADTILQAIYEWGHPQYG